MAEVKKGKVALFLITSTLLITFIFYGYQIFYTPNILVDREDRVFLVKSGSTYRDVQINLGRGNFVNDMVSFSFLARLYGYDEKIVPGRFVLRRNMTNLEAIKILKSGKQEPVRVTFTHVRLFSELGEKITKNIGVAPKEFYDAAARFIASNNSGFNDDNALAMYLPNTYEMYYNISADGLVERMYAEYNKFWNTTRLEKAKRLGLTPIEVSILASIVQAETVKQEEAPVIAGLYLNRLKKDMPLQADPTLVFAVGDFSLKRVLDKHKEVDSPYNTYKNRGLPPGPINMPQLANIDAVLDHQKSTYLYMCAREDFSGFHNFAATLAEHSKNARKYQTALTIEQRKAAQNKR